MSLPDIRRARDYLAKEMGVPYPFASERLKTDGVDIAMDYQHRTGQGEPGTLLLANRQGQLAWNDFIGGRMKEFEYEDSLALRWHVGGEGSLIVIDPRVRFGAPTIRGVPTWLVQERHQAGEAKRTTASDLGLTVREVTEALSFEAPAPKRQRKSWHH